jgi:riboflavin biosynthesis pyrimidine reductase
MAVRASFIIGKDGSSTKSDSSLGLSNETDKARFKDLRKQCDVVLIGGNTARSEPYSSLKKPLVILTREQDILLKDKPDSYQFNLSIAEALPMLKDKFGENILIEAGWQLLSEAIEQQLVDELYLTINHDLSGENPIDLNLLNQNMFKAESEITNGTELAKYLKHRT